MGDQWAHMAGEEGQQRGLVEAKRDKNLLSRVERVGTWCTDGLCWNPTLSVRWGLWVHPRIHVLLLPQGLQLDYISQPSFLRGVAM